MYYIEYTSNSGKRVPSKHKMFESVDQAEQHGQMTVAAGLYKRYNIVEGWSELPPINREKYQSRDGLEGPIQTKSGKTVYYDPKAGMYYDPDTDMYISYDDWKLLDSPKMHKISMSNESVEALRQIVTDKNSAKVNGVLVDLFTASAIMQVYDAVNDANKEKMDSMLKTKAGLLKMADFAMTKVESATNEGCSPHKKGTKKYKAHMAAKHAAMAEGDIDSLSETLSPEEKKLVNQMYNKDGTLTALGKKVMNHGKTNEVTEGVADEAVHMERDHEVQMARSDLYKIANYAVKLHKMLKNVSEEQGIQGWMQAKITKSADYMSSVAHTLEYDMMEKHQGEPMAEAMDASKYHCEDCGCQMHNCKPECNCSHDSHDETGSWWKDADGNGVPDAFESVQEAKAKPQQNLMAKTKALGKITKALTKKK